jgi:hypothetical protein
VTLTLRVARIGQIDIHRTKRLRRSRTEPAANGMDFMPFIEL